MTPKCCKDCKNTRTADCASFRTCVRWREWFKEQWEDIRAAAAPIQEERPTKGESTSSLCTYTTDPCTAMDYKGRRGTE